MTIIHHFDIDNLLDFDRDLFPKSLDNNINLGPSAPSNTILNHECEICNEENNSITLKCEHYMCKNCYDKISNINNLCPFCRSPMSVEHKTIPDDNKVEYIKINNSQFIENCITQFKNVPNNVYIYYCKVDKYFDCFIKYKLLNINSDIFCPNITNDYLIQRLISHSNTSSQPYMMKIDYMYMKRKFRTSLLYNYLNDILLNGKTLRLLQEEYKHNINIYNIIIIRYRSNKYYIYMSNCIINEGVNTSENHESCKKGKGKRAIDENYDSDYNTYENPDIYRCSNVNEHSNNDEGSSSCENKRKGKNPS